MSNIKNLRFEIEDCKKVDAKFYLNNSNKTIQEKDILMARSGEGTIGKVAIIENAEVEGAFADFIMRIRLINNKQKFAYYFRSELFQYLVYTHKKGLGNNTNIFPSQIQEFSILDFNLSKQSELVEQIQVQLDRQKVIKEQIKGKQKQIGKIIEEAIKL